MSAVAETLTTTELLEAVLRKLPMEDLLRAQQVSKYWAQVIAGSIAIQKALFMRPGTATEAAVDDSFRYTHTKADGTTSEIAVNPCFCDSDGIVKDYTGYRCFLTRRAVDSRSCPRDFALMSITQPPMKLKMIIVWECGDGPLARRRNGIRVMAQETHREDAISEVLKRIHLTVRESAQKSAVNDTGFVDSSIDVMSVWFSLRDLG